MPLFWDKMVHPYCLAINTKNVFLLDYYGSKSSTSNKLQSKILKMIIDANKIYKQDGNFSKNNITSEIEINNFRKLNFGIFTVINTTDDEYVNNPPNPPYLNPNKIIYYSRINYNYKKLGEEIT